MYKLLLILFFSFSLTVNAQDSLKHSIELGQRYENYLERDTYRYITSLQYGYKIKNKHDIFGRLLYQNRNGDNATQGIVDFYPTYDKGYMFFSVRYSNNILFPKIIVMGEVYRNFLKIHEASIGLRYINPIDDYNIYVITGTYGIYYGNWYTYIRPMFNIIDDGVGWSGMIVTRLYFADGKPYIEGAILYGDDTGSERPYNSIENSFGLNTYMFRLKGNLPLRNNFNLAFGTDYSGILIPKANNLTTEVNILGFDVTLKKTF
jgi:YaiO family outer membrane protein